MTKLFYLYSKAWLVTFLMLVLTPVPSNARKYYFELDPQVLAHRPFHFKAFRVITPKYNDPKTKYYSLGSPVELSTPTSLASQIEALLENSACKDCERKDTLTIAIQDFNFYDSYRPGDVMLLYIYADFFIGSNGSLRHIYTTDRWFQKKQLRDKLGTYSMRFVSDCVLTCAEDACVHVPQPSKETFTNEQADNYYEDGLKKYPLYTRNTAPRGIYKTVEDFINLTPLDTPLIFEHIPQQESDGFNWFYYKTPNGEKGKRVPAKEVYIISEGTNFWLSHDGRFHKIKKQDGDYFYEAAVRFLAHEESPYNLGAAGILMFFVIEESMAAAGNVPMKTQMVPARFSPQLKRFIPYGGRAPRLR